eukprot:728926-Pyramimonas_sp.AAC.1
MRTVGRVAASSYRIDSGLWEMVWSPHTTSVPKQPAARPNTPTPACSACATSSGDEKPPASPPPPHVDKAVSTPAQSAPGRPGSPGYMPKTFRTSRKLSPTECT